MSENASWARLWTTLAARVIRENREVLIELDRAIGDGDHGENLDRGYSAIMKDPDVLDGESGADVLRTVARKLIAEVGGAAGPLLGTAYLRAGAKVPESPMTAEDIVAVLEAGMAGIQARGKAEPGDKTMVDAWDGAIAAAKTTVAQGVTDPTGVWEAAAAGAEAGAASTIPLKALKGRASYLGERSRGHLDPGAQSSALILRAAAEAARQLAETEGQRGVTA